jgi:membrane associated rhomboid family serine protease
MAECYRHPGRETNVQCSNCGRPICPDCMTVTPVGMRCPECARDRTQVRRISPGLRGGAAPAAYALIAINVVAFIAEVGAGGSVASGGGSLFFDGALYGPAVADGEWYRIVTAGFLHAGIIHLAFNMFGIYILINIFFTIGAASHISVGGHFGGLIGGALCALLIVFAERRARRPMGLEALGMAALGAISVAGALAVV